jgi:hypothetical protein
MKDVIKLILILLTIITILSLFSYNYKIKKIISNIKLRNYVKLSKNDQFNLYNFLETKYNDILLPNDIIFKEYGENFICENLKIITNKETMNITVLFKPIKDLNLITKYSFFHKYGVFEIIENQENNSDVPNIDHLSSDNSDDLNFDINEIINSDIKDMSNNANKDMFNQNISNQEIFLKNIDNINNNDTENESTETLINNAL